MAHSTSGVERCARAPGCGLGRLTSKSITHIDLHKLNNKLVSAQLHLWCTYESWADTDSQDSPQTRLRGSHHFPPYSIFLCLATWPAPKCHFISGLPKLGLMQLWRPISLCTKLWLRWGLKQCCSSYWELSNGMWHTICTQGIHVNSWLLVVGSQIGNLTPGRSFGHRLCFNYPNGSCEPILDIQVLITFQWYKKFFNQMGFDLCNHSLKFRSP